MANTTGKRSAPYFLCKTVTVECFVQAYETEKVADRCEHTLADMVPGVESTTDASYVSSILQWLRRYKESERYSLPGEGSGFQ